MKACPFCAEEIQDAAIVCKHCGRDIVATPLTSAPSVAPAVPQATAAPAAVKPRTVTRGRQALAFALVVVGFFMTFGGYTAGLGFFMMWVGIGIGLSSGVVARWGGGFLLAMILSAVGMTISGSSRSYRATRPNAAASATSSPRTTTTSTVVPPAAPVAATYQLALISSRGYESEYGGYHIVEGQVKNVSGEPLEHVTAVSTWYDKDGNFIKSDDAIIDYDPILPGQTSPFKTMSTGNPAMSKYTVEFKRLMGGTLSVDDQRKK